MTTHKTHVHAAIVESDRIIYKPGPYCTDHRSYMCEHALDAIKARLDVPAIEGFLLDTKKNTQFTLMVPLWYEYFIWEELLYKTDRDDVFGPYANLLPTLGRSDFHIGVEKLSPGEGIGDLGSAMHQAFEDIVELEGINPGKGCRSGSHTWDYQNRFESVREDPAELAPHVYTLRARNMCAFCWADMYGAEAKRVSDLAPGLIKSTDVDWEDLIPDSSVGGPRRTKFTK